MTLPSGERWESMGMILLTKQRFSTWNTSPSRLELISSGQKSRKFRRALVRV